MKHTDDQVREAFEASVRNSKAAGRTPLGTMQLNGKFSHYMDPDTDTLWVGYRAGYRSAEHAHGVARPPGPVAPDATNANTGS